jgi:hypothetical protein
MATPSEYDVVKQGLKLGLRARKAVANGQFTPFIPALAMALTKDSLLDFIPIVGNLLGLFITVFLFVFLWGKGKIKVRIVIFILSFFDVIPAVNLIPFSTICVAYAFLQARKEAEQAKKELVGIETVTNAQRTRQYQMAQAMQAQAEQQAANDDATQQRVDDERRSDNSDKPKRV